MTRISAALALAVALFLAVPASGSSRTAAFPGKNGKIVFPVGKNLGTLDERPADFYTVTPRGTGLRRLLMWRPRREGPSSVQWSPTGREIVFNGQCGITIATATGTHRRCLGVDGFDPSWSPDASQVVYEGNKTGGVYTLQIVTRVGRLVTTIPITAGFPTDLAWSPRDNRIAFAVSATSRVEGGIYTVAADGSALERLVSGSGDPDQPNWSPDGKHILFVRAFALWLIDANGANERRLLVVRRNPAAPEDASASAVWSPDGTRIAYASPGARSISIFTLRTRTRRTIPLRLPRGFVVSWNERLDWQPIRR